METRQNALSVLWFLFEDNFDEESMTRNDTSVSFLKNIFYHLSLFLKRLSPSGVCCSH